MSLLHLHSERGVNTVVEVQIGGAVVGSVCDPQVTVSDPTVQLLLYSELLRDTGHTIYYKIQQEILLNPQRVCSVAFL